MLEELPDSLKQLDAEVDRLIAEAGSVDDLRQAESQLTGKKGSLGKLLASLGKLPPDHRAAAGKQINLAKKRITDRFAAARAGLE